MALPSGQLFDFLGFSVDGFSGGCWKFGYEILGDNFFRWDFLVWFWTMSQQRRDVMNIWYRMMYSHYHLGFCNNRLITSPYVSIYQNPVNIRLKVSIWDLGINGILVAGLCWFVGSCGDAYLMKQYLMKQNHKVRGFQHVRTKWSLGVTWKKAHFCHSKKVRPHQLDNVAGVVQSPSEMPVPTYVPSPTSPRDADVGTTAPTAVATQLAPTASEPTMLEYAQVGLLQRQWLIW